MGNADEWRFIGDLIPQQGGLPYRMHACLMERQCSRGGRCATVCEADCALCLIFLDREAETEECSWKTALTQRCPQCPWMRIGARLISCLHPFSRDPPKSIAPIGSLEHDDAITENTEPTTQSTRPITQQAELSCSGVSIALGIWVQVVRHPPCPVHLSRSASFHAEMNTRLTLTKPIAADYR